MVARAGSAEGELLPSRVPEPGVQLAALKVHRESIRLRTDRLDWWHKPIPLTVRSRDRTHDARDYLARWCASDTGRHSVLIGAPGAGKSGLIWWAASVIAELPNSFALIVSARKLRVKRPIDLNLLFETTNPPIDASLARPIVKECRLFVLLDGLDELSGVDSGGETRVLASCRVLAFPPMEQVLAASLPRVIEDDDELYKSVLEKTFGTADELEVMKVSPVRREHALAFLAQFLNPSALNAIMADDRWAPFLTSPIQLLLAKDAKEGVSRCVPQLASCHLSR